MLCVATSSGQLQSSGNVVVAGSTQIAADWHVAGPRGSSYLFNGSGVGEEAIALEAPKGERRSVVFGGEGLHIFRATAGKPAIRVGGEGDKFITFAGAPNFIYGSEDRAPMALLADGKSTVRVFGKSGERNIFFGGIGLRDGGPAGNARLELCGGDWLLLGSFEGVDIVKMSHGTSCGILPIASDAGSTCRVGCAAAFELLRHISSSPYSCRGDGLRCETAISVAKVLGDFSGIARQQWAVLSAAKSFRWKTPFLPSYGEISIGSAAAEIRCGNWMKSFLRCHRNYLFAAHGNHNFGCSFIDWSVCRSLSSGRETKNFVTSVGVPRYSGYRFDAMFGATFVRQRLKSIKDELLRAVAIGAGRMAYAARCVGLEAFLCPSSKHEARLARTFLRSAVKFSSTHSNVRLSLERGVEADLCRMVSGNAPGVGDASTGRFSGSLTLSLSASWPRICLVAMLSGSASSGLRASTASLSVTHCF
jgi:hypothetical protein